NGLSITRQYDTTGNGTFDRTRTDVTVLNADGSKTETITDINANGSLRDQTVRTISANRLTVTTQTDANGDGHIGETETAGTNPDGSVVDTVSLLNPNGSPKFQTVTTTSADGLSVTTQRNNTGNGSFDQTRTDVVVINADGSRTETVTDVSATGSLEDQFVTT